MLRVGDFDLGRGTVRVHGKGGKVVVLPLGFKTLKRDLEVYLVGRDAREYLLYPKDDLTRPMHRASVHDWFSDRADVAQARIARDDGEVPAPDSGGPRSRSGGSGVSRVGEGAEPLALAVREAQLDITPVIVRSTIYAAPLREAERNTSRRPNASVRSSRVGCR